MAVVRVEAIKAEIQSLGVRLDPGTARDLRVRRGGAGPAEGITILLDGSPASVPVCSGFVSRSPFRVERSGEGWLLYRGADRLSLHVEIPPEPRFYRKTTPAGIPFRKIALLHGADCLASTVLQACTYWGTELACRFCGVGISWKAGSTVLKKEPADLAAAAMEAKAGGVRHVTLTAGSTGNRETEWRLLRRAARAIRDQAGLPVHVQMMPPLPRAWMERLRDDGVESIGIHLESFDPSVLRRVAPCKASICPDEYLRAWKEAVRVFGANQVSSFLLMGLGERPESLLDGCERLAELGVYPYLVPFRPIPGTSLADEGMIPPHRAQEIYGEAASILERMGLHWRRVRAGCVRCRGCSALPDYQEAFTVEWMIEEGPQHGLAWRVVRGGSLLQVSYAIREEVFVKEQGMFSGTDRDELDPVSYHILAFEGRTCVGTVRITPLGSGVWLGSRLAVRKPYRGHAGAFLVQRAETEVRRRGGRRFVAYVQAPRAGFFERCGWRRVRWIPDYHGRPHFLMEASGPLWQEQGCASRSIRDNLPEAVERMPR